MSRLECINNLFDIVLEDVELFVGDFEDYLKHISILIDYILLLLLFYDNQLIILMHFRKAASDQLFFHQGPI